MIPSTMVKADTQAAGRLELILQQIDALPTLPAVAAELLSLTANHETHARQVIERVSADQALTAKVLAMCRHADRGIRDQAITIDRAVVLLGFGAIRSAVLSIKVFETFGLGVRSQGGEEVPARPAMDRAAFWRHSLAVALLAENLAKLARQPDLLAGEAFVCGLLHDLGKLALDHVLPRSYARVVELADQHQGDIAQVERRIIGLDHHTAGKRLAEQWKLPHRLADCLWLHGTPYASLPRLAHRRMIGLVTLADIMARQRQLGYSGNHRMREQPAALATALGLNEGVLAEACLNLTDQLDQRCELLGLGRTPSRQTYVHSVEKANGELGRLNQALQQRMRVATQHGRMLEAIGRFHAAATPGRSVQEVLGAVVESFALTFGSGFHATVHPQRELSGEHVSWLVCQHQPDGQVVRSQVVTPPPGAPDLVQLDAHEPWSVTLSGVLPWIADDLIDAPDLREVKLLPLGCAWGTAALLLHDRKEMPSLPAMTALVATWGAAVAAATQHEGARRLGEDLAQANRALAEAQDRMASQASLARLGEMAAGAAHEMNNPLAIISGRSQLLAMSLPAGGKDAKAARTISEQAHRLSDLITALRMLADPPMAKRQPADVSQLLNEVVRQVRLGDQPIPPGCELSIQVKQTIAPVLIDAQQVSQALMELVANALQAAPRHMVRLSASLTPEGELVIQVTDDGLGMDDHTLAHALDPFFSAKPAGRRAGLGLSRAQQWAAAHGGRVELRRQAPQGSVVSLVIPLDSPL